MSEHDDLVARARELGIDGVSSRWKDETLREKIQEAEDARDVGVDDGPLADDDAAPLPAPADSRPIEETTEPTKVEANNARFDEDHPEAGAVGIDDETLHPEPEPVQGPQDRDFMEAIREADKSQAFSAQMVTNVEAGIINEPSPANDPGNDDQSGVKAEDASANVGDDSAGSGGPAERMS